MCGGDLNRPEKTRTFVVIDIVAMPPKSKAKGKKAAEPVTEEVAVTAVAMEEEVAQSNNSSGPSAKDNALVQLAEELWGSSSKNDFLSFKESVVRTVFKDTKGIPAKFQLLEFRGYLENYLWAYYSPDACLEHTLSILLVVNEKCKAGVPVFDILVENAETFKSFSKNVIDLSANNQIEESFQEPYILFLINLFRSLDHAVVRQSALRYLSLPMWAALSKTRLQIELENSTPLQKPWQKLQAKLDELTAGDATATATGDAKGGKKKRKASAAVTSEGPSEESAQLQRESQWFPSLVRSFIAQCGALSSDEPVPTSSLRHMERFAELLIDLLSQLPTRRFLKALLDDMHFLAISRRWVWLERPECLLFKQLLQSVSNVLHFEVDDLTGKALTPQETLERTNAVIHTLQQVAYAEYPEAMKDIVFSSVGELGKRDQLLRHMQLFTVEQLTTLATKMHVLTEKDLQSSEEHFSDPVFLKELVCDAVAQRESQLEQFNLTSLLPTEKLLWDQSQLPLGSSYTGGQTLPLPKLNMQFLTVHDYLLRNYTLFRLESAYEVREDLTDAIKRMGPREGHNGVTSFGGWARMALPLVAFSIDQVSKPKLGEVVPKHVDATATVDISRYTGEIRDEWEAFKNHDVVFLVTIDRPHPDAALRLAEFEKERKLLSAGKATPVLRDFQWNEEQLDFMKLFGVKYVRGGTVFEFRDEADVVLNDPSRPDDRKYGRTGTKRKLRLNLDPVQYYLDMKDGLTCYDTLNLLVRRNPKENNFKAILDTIRGLINTAAVGQAIPSWLHDVFLGYGDPAAASFRQIDDGKSHAVDYVDTFLDAQHLIDSFPAAKDIVFESDAGSVTVKSNGKLSSSLKAGTLPPPPYSLSFSGSPGKTGKTKTDDSSSAASAESIVARHITQPSPGPYPSDAPPRNSVRFTPSQVEAIRSGVSPGLSVVVGPPGTGKTDVAVQIISNLYHNHPTQKILIVTHSNAALNDLFEKIMQRDIAPRHLLRLGSGESELRESLAADGAGGSGRGQGEAFSKQGRVNWSLARRLELLEQVQALSQSLKVAGDNGLSCETAEYFQIGQVVPRIQKFNLEVNRRQATQDTTIEQLFPFSAYFSNTPAPLFTGSWASDLQAAVGCFRHLSKLFEELADYRAFELLHSHALRSDYLLIKQARIVAMTCTHAAMTRGRLVELGFKYDSVVMEEAGQILEVETLIPMLLQDSDPLEGSRLKRVVLLGDHHQLPPVVKHMALQKFSHFDQSLFSRFIRLGVPAIHLDKQGRAKPEIATLYRWRYNSHGHTLSDMESVSSGVYANANAGFRHSVQLIDVPPFQGRGETSPTPYFYQNLGEAEYIVAVYQYMRLIGYPAEKISILTSYNGQKHLIRDIIAQRCQNAVFGPPAHVATVDQFQGQQNDFILLSLVRTESVGHLRDVRRLVVAMSRARLGLYVFCRRSLFEGCFELSPAIQQLLTKPTSLQLIAGEGFPSQRKADAAVDESSVHTVTDATEMGILVYQMVQLAQNSAK